MSKKHILEIALALIVVILIGWGIYSTNSNSSNTSTWQTYSDIEYNFKYPQDLIVRAGKSSPDENIDCLGPVSIYNKKDIANHVGDNDLEEILSICPFDTSSTPTKLQKNIEFPSGGGEVFFVMNSDRGVRIHSNNDQHVLIEDILSTFRFTK